jgi:GNAT superfamily N-acetyltransferase
MTIELAETDEAIERCYPVMAELRPHLRQDQFVSRIRLQQREGYILAFGETGQVINVVAGYRIIEQLSVGRMLYVDDLVSASFVRGQGHGKRMLDWLKAQARHQNCQALHLDSGVQRFDAHRFYHREGLVILWHHFACSL